jgi:hypothetical protein
MVVSQEPSASEKHKPKKSYYIPDVCASFPSQAGKRRITD